MKISSRPASYGKSYGSKAGDKEHHSNRGKANGHGGNEETSSAGGVRNELLSGHSQSDAHNSETAGYDTGSGHGAGKANSQSRNTDHGNAYGHQSDAEKKFAHDVTAGRLSSRSQGVSVDSEAVDISKADQNAKADPHANADNQSHKGNPGNAYGHNTGAVNKPAGVEKNAALRGNTQGNLQKAKTSGGSQSGSVGTEEARSSQQTPLQTSAHTVQTSAHTVQTSAHTVQTSAHTVQTSAHTVQSGANTVQTTSSYSHQWVRIPFPLSSFYPPSPFTGSTASGGSAAGTQPETNNFPSGSSNGSEHPNSNPNANNGDLVAAQHQYSAISGWFGSQAREDTVASVNEAGDAIWKNTRPSPRDDFNSEDL